MQEKSKNYLIKALKIQKKFRTRYLYEKILVNGMIKKIFKYYTDNPKQIIN